MAAGVSGPKICTSTACLAENTGVEFLENIIESACKMGVGHFSKENTFANTADMNHAPCTPGRRLGDIRRNVDREAQLSDTENDPKTSVSGPLEVLGPPRRSYQVVRVSEEPGLS